jgi:putative selenium metabolism hydrolase
MWDLASDDLQAMTTFLQDLVRTPSLSTQEANVAARLAQEMRRLGFADVWTDRIGNVVGRIGAGRGRKLLFNGHMDTVAVTDVAAWSRDPFGAQIEAGILYGRGAVDMKGALAAMVYAAKLLLDAQVPLNGDLYVTGVVQEEECEGLGMRVLVEEEGLRPDWVVLGEPTDLQVARGQPGRMGLRVTVKGRSAHASAPHLGENAIYGAAHLIGELRDLAEKVAREQRGAMAVTQIESKAGSLNAVPDHCSFYIDRRLAVGETETTVLDEIGEIIRRADLSADLQVTPYRATSYTGYGADQREYYPAWALEEDHPLVQAAVRAVREELEYEPRVKLWDFSTDGVYTMGTAGIPTVGFGPGEERHAHTAQEQILLQDVVAAARVYAQLAADLLA